ncbi:ALP1-like protein isoform X1 [Tanacetum coccineum]
MNGSERGTMLAIFRVGHAFYCNPDCAGREGISPLIKCTSAIRQLAYGVNASFLDEYMQISERSSRLSLDHFCQAVMEIYGPEFLRKPTVTDVEKLYRHHEEKHGFPGMLGSLDCTDWEWFGCPYAFKGQYVRRDHGSNPFILLEAVASQDLWIWHAFFGVAGSNNDINVLYQSPIFNDLKTGRAPEIPFVANGVTYPSGYYLVDGIYPELAPLVKTIPEPADDDHKRILYKQKQESARKDVERAFGVLKKKWAILANPTRALRKDRIVNYWLSHLGSRVYTLELRDLPYKINEAVHENVKEPVQIALQAPLRDRFRDLSEEDKKEMLHQRMFETGSYKSLLEHIALYEALEASMERAQRDEFLAEKDKSHAPSSSSKQQSGPHAEQPVDDIPIQDSDNISDSEDTDSAHLPKTKQKPKCLKPIPDDERLATSEPAWVIPTSHIPDVVNNWANALATTYQAPAENSLPEKTRDMQTFMN